MASAASAGRNASSGASADRRALDALVRVSQMLAGDLELGSLLESAMRAGAAAMEAEACSILLADAEAAGLRFHVVDGPQTGGLGDAAVPIDDHSLAGWVAGRGEPLLVPDAYADRRFDPTYDARTGFRTRSIITAPLAARGRALGVIQVLNRRDGQPFDDRDLELALGVADLVAVAIHNAEEHEARLAAERLATVGRTVAGMAHCVKNILNGLRAGSYILDQHLGEAQASGVAKGWGMVKRNVQFLSDIVLDMLSYSRRREPMRRQTRLGALCEDVAALVADQAAEKGVEIATSTDATEAWLDEAGLKRCLLNLAGNALDACAASGALVELAAGPGGEAGTVELSVRDNGRGIAPEDAARIFDPFFSTKGNRGTGLGLAVTRKLVEEHGGRIEVASTPGRGTTFTITLPAARPSEEPRKEPPPRGTHQE